MNKILITYIYDNRNRFWDDKKCSFYQKILQAKSSKYCRIELKSFYKSKKKMGKKSFNSMRSLPSALCICVRTVLMLMFNF